MDYFSIFLAGYVDAEGCWSISPDMHYGCLRFVFKIGSSDQLILSQIASKLNSLGFNPHLYLARRAGANTGSIKSNKEIYALYIYTRENVVQLACILLPLSWHSEKIRKMQLILKHEHAKYWGDIEADIVAMRQQIKQEVTWCKHKAEIEWQKKHEFTVST